MTRLYQDFSLLTKQEKKCPTGISSEDTSTSISTTTSTPTECNSNMNTSTDTLISSSTDSSTDLSSDTVTNTPPSDCPTSDHDGKPFIPPKDEEGKKEVFNIRNNIFSYDDAKKFVVIWK